MQRSQSLKAIETHKIHQRKPQSKSPSTLRLLGKSWRKKNSSRLPSKTIPAVNKRIFGSDAKPNRHRNHPTKSRQNHDTKPLSNSLINQIKVRAFYLIGLEHNDMNSFSHARASYESRINVGN